MLTKMDAQDVANGEISKKAFVIMRRLRFIPLGGLTMATFDTGSELLSKAECLTAESINQTADEESKILYDQISKL